MQQEIESAFQKLDTNIVKLKRRKWLLIQGEDTQMDFFPFISLAIVLDDIEHLKKFSLSLSQFSLLDFVQFPL